MLSPEGVPVTVSLVLIFGGSDLTRGADPASEGISWTTVSRILTWGGSDPACGAGGGVLDPVATVVAGLPPLGCLPKLAPQAFRPVIQPTADKFLGRGLDFFL